MTTMKWTPEQYAEYLKRRGSSPPQASLEEMVPKPSKMHNIFEECDNIRFQSKLEAAYYRALCCRVKAGEVAYFLRQVPLHLRGNVKYLCDFVEFWKDGSVHYVEVKGHETDMWKLKKKLAEDQYPIRIEVYK